MIQGCLLQLWMHKCSRQQSNLQLLSTEKLTNVDERITKLWDWFCTGNMTGSAQQVKYVGNSDVFCFGFYFTSPKWAKTKIVIEITLFLQAFSSLPLVQAPYRFLRIGPEALIEIGFVLIAHNPFHHVLVCIFII